MSAGSTICRGVRGCGLLAVLAVACDSGEAKPATQLLVTVDSDLVVGSELTSVQVEVRNAAGARETPRHTFVLTTSKPKDAEVRLPFSFGITKAGESDFQLRVTGLDGDKTVVDHRWNVSFEDEKTLGLSVFLGAICAGNLCSDGQTCYSRRKGEIPAGACADVPDASVTPVEPGEELRDRDAGAPAAEAGSGGAGRGGAGTGTGTSANTSAGAGAGGGGRGAAGSGGTGRGGAGGAGGVGASGAGAGGAGAGGAGAGGAAGSAGAGTGCGACRPGESCVSGACHCASTVVDYYRDADGDGHGDPSMKQSACGAAPVGYVTASDDCCDSDNRAYPGQTQGDVTPSVCAAVGFDFDCDGNGEIGWPYLRSGVCCANGERDGWEDLIPGCGETGVFSECDTACDTVSSAAKQRCY
jgi:hypothetical protein